MTPSRPSLSRRGSTAAIGLALAGTTVLWGSGTATALPRPADGTQPKAVPHTRAACPPAPLWANTGGGDHRLIEYSPTGTQLFSVPVVRDYGDIGFSADGGTLYGIDFPGSAPALRTIDPATGAETASVAVTGPAASPSVSVFNALSPLPSGLLLTGTFSTNTIFTIDPATGASAVFGASFPAGFVSAGDFLSLADGDILASASPAGSSGSTPSAIFRIHPDNTLTEVGTVPTTFGMALSGSDVYLFGANGNLNRLTAPIPTAASTDPLAFTQVSATGNAFFGATSVQDSGNCNTVAAPSITKTAAEGSFVTGETIHYTYTVTNRADVPLTTVAVTDNGPGTPTVTCPAGPLAPGASANCTASYPATAADTAAGRIVNTATVTAAAPTGQVVTATSNQVSVPLRALAVTKKATETQFTAAGQTIHYTYTVTNTGQAPLTGVGVTDLTPGVNVSGCGVDQLAPGATTTCQATYVTTAADVANKNVTDQGRATGTAPGGESVTTTSNTAVVPLDALAVVKKAAEAQFTAAGQTIHYTYTVTNNGAEALTSVTVADNGPGTPAVTCPAGPLAPGTSVDCTATYVTTAADVAAGKIVNTATVTATTPSGSTVTGTSNTVTEPFAGLKIVKAVQETAFSAPGQVLHYTFTVTNTGNVPLGTLAVTDVAPGTPVVSCPVPTLAPGAGTTCTATYTTTAADVKAGRITDTATVTATTPDGTTVTSRSNTLTVTACTPCEDKDHGGCEGDNPDGHEGGGHDGGGHDGGGHHPPGHDHNGPGGATGQHSDESHGPLPAPEAPNAAPTGPALQEAGLVPLAHTGSPTRTAGIAGAGALALGLLLVHLGRTRKHAATTPR
ncbi:hypothetical protein OH807_38800 [Kitasatospora sp. NBC_01560]|uniref:DUF7507 domain-containing protein n=1 Tax=Kitasatospora sp. NBC_01560 TaxID=2975965 RepID=UPI00386BC5A2